MELNMRPNSTSYTRSQWSQFLERVTFLYKSGRTYEEIAGEMRLSEDLIRATVERYVLSLYKTK